MIVIKIVVIFALFYTSRVTEMLRSRPLVKLRAYSTKFKMKSWLSISNCDNLPRPNQENENFEFPRDSQRPMLIVVSWNTVISIQWQRIKWFDPYFLNIFSKSLICFLENSLNSVYGLNTLICRLGTFSFSFSAWRRASLPASSSVSDMVLQAFWWDDAKKKFRAMFCKRKSAHPNRSDVRRNSQHSSRGLTCIFRTRTAIGQRYLLWDIKRLFIGLLNTHPDWSPSKKCLRKGNSKIFIFTPFNNQILSF